MIELIYSGLLRQTLAEFWPTLLTELAVMLLVLQRLKRSSPGLGSFGRRLTLGSTKTAGLWCLPFYLWAWQANQLVLELLSHPRGVAAATLIDERAVFTIFIALFFLLVLRTVNALIAREAPATLGLIGHPRTAVTAAMLSVFLEVALYFWLLRESAAPYGLPLRLS